MPDTETLEQPAAETVAPVIEAPAVESESLADHARSFGPDRQRDKPESAVPAAETTESAATDGERDAQGKFKPKHRAKSQEATTEDVPRIQALTRKLRETERELESFRNRPAPAAERAAEPEPARARATDAFPSVDEWLTIKGNENGDWHAYNDARTIWNYERLRTAERAEESAKAEQATFHGHAQKYASEIDAVAKEFPDFESVVEASPQVSKVMERAVIEAGPRTAYWLATHADECEALTNDTLLDASGQPITPQHPAFKATVAATRRYLSTLVASEQRSSSPPSRAAAASTGSARASVVQPAPRPPNPVRTGSIRESDTPPGDDSSLADHVRAYSPKKRR
jgi:hypothetical protein